MQGLHLNGRKGLGEKMETVILLYLGILGIWDLRHRCVPTIWLMAGLLLLPGIGISRCMGNELQWTELLLGMIPGMVMTLVAWLTKKAGYADGIVLLELGACLGYREVVVMFCFSLLLIALASAVLLVLRKVGRNTKIPYLPFLFVVYCVRVAVV